MKQKIHLEFSHGKWYAVHRTTVDGKTKRKYVALKIEGKEKRRTADKAFNEYKLRLAIDENNGQSPDADNAVIDYAEEYLAAAKLDVRPATYRSYALWIRRFAMMYGDMAIGDVTPRVIEEFKQALADELAIASVNVALRSVRAMFGRSVRQRVIAHSPFDGVNLADEPQRTFPPFWTTEQYLKFIAGIETQRQRVGFGLAFYAGLCARECVTLRWENLGRDHIHVVNREHARTQGDRSRKVPLYEPLRKEIDRLPNIGAYVLSSEYNEISDERSLSQKFLKYRRRIATLPEISFHGLRHSFATGCAFRGMPLPVLHKIMGHANISTTAMYLHVQEDAAVDTAHKFAPQLPTIF